MLCDSKDIFVLFGQCHFQLCWRRGTDEESKNGELFHVFLARTGMALPATFRGGGGTWQDRMGRWHRLDYVGVACDELPAVSHVEVDQEGVLAVQERETHRLVIVSMQVVLSEAGGTFPRICLWGMFCRSREVADASGSRFH